MFFVYAYENKINGKVYIGQTDDLQERDNGHTKWGDKQMHIDRSIKKYGRDNFYFWTVEIVETKEQANQAEIYWIAEMRIQLGETQVYNKSNGGEAFMRGRKHTEEWKQLMSQKMTGRKFTEEAKANMSAAAMGKPGTNTGKIFDDEWRINISKANAGKENKLKRRFTDEQELEICRQYIEDKKSTYILGQQLDCQRTLIADILKRRNITQRQSNYRGHSNGKNLFTKEQELEICELYNSGKVSRNELSKQFNCGRTTIRDILLRNNIKLGGSYGETK